MTTPTTQREADERAKCQCYYGEYCPACASLTPTAPQAASQQVEQAHLIVSTAAGADRLAVLVSVKRGDITTVVYSRYHSMNGDSVGVESISADIVAPQAATTASASEHCPHCDDTGDVHTPTGEWRGECNCPAGISVTLDRLKVAAKKVMCENEELRAALARAPLPAQQVQAVDVSRDAERLDMIERETKKLGYFYIHNNKARYDMVGLSIHIDSLRAALDGVIERAQSRTNTTGGNEE